MLVMNNQKRTVHIGYILLLPGSNIVADGSIDENHPVIKVLCNSGKLSFEKNVTANVAANAISRASSRQVITEIEKSLKKSNASVRKAAAARRTELDEFDAEWEEAKKKQEQSKKAASTI